MPLLADVRSAPRTILNEAVEATAWRQEHRCSNGRMQLDQRVRQISFRHTAIVVAPVEPHLVAAWFEHHVSVTQ